MEELVSGLHIFLKILLQTFRKSFLCFWWSEGTDLVLQFAAFQFFLCNFLILIFKFSLNSGKSPHV